MDFNEKINYLISKVKEKKNIGLDLLDILDDKDFINKVHKDSQDNIKQALYSSERICDDKEKIVISLILIGMLEYDGNFYSYVQGTYNDLYEKFSSQKIEGFIRSILHKYERKYEILNKERNINVALRNAIVPKEYLSSFFEFIYDIYKINFEYYLPTDTYNGFKFVYNGLKHNTSLDGDEISVKATQKTYKLISTTKKLIKNEEDLDCLIKFSTIVSEIIDRWYWNKGEEVLSPYFKYGFEKWKNNFESKKSNHKENRKSISEFRSRWEPKFLLKNNSVFIEPPIHHIESKYNYKDLVVKVFNDDEEIYSDSNCNIKEIFGGYQINSHRIEIKKPLNKLRYKLLCGETTIYDSKNKLYRNFIVFDSSGVEISNNTNFEGTVIVCHKDIEKDIGLFKNDDFYYLSYKNVKNGDVICISNEIFNFSTKLSPGVFGEKHQNCFIHNLDKDKYIEVYKEVKNVYFEESTEIEKFEISINNKNYKISDFKYEVYEREGINKYVLNLDLKDDGIYCIKIYNIFNGKKFKILENTFLLDSVLNFSYKKLSDEGYNVEISNCMLENKKSIEVYPDSFDVNYLKFSYKDENYNYIIPINLKYYSLNNKEWNCSSLWFWIDDIKYDTEFLLVDHEIDNVKVLGEDNSIIEDDIGFEKSYSFIKLPISFLRNFKNNYKYIKLAFYIDEFQKYSITCYNSCVIDEERTEITFLDRKKSVKDSNCVKVSPIFYGKNKVNFKIKNKDNKDIYNSEYFESGKSIYLRGLKSFKEYTFRFFEITNSLLKKENLIYEKKEIFYFRDDFINRIFKIDTASYKNFKEAPFEEKKCDFRFVFLEIIERIDDNNFIGEIFIKTNSKKWKLDINPVEIEICSEVLGNIIEVFITNNGDGLLLDTNKHEILNTLTDHYAQDIYLFELNFDQRGY